MVLINTGSWEGFPLQVFQPFRQAAPEQPLEKGQAVLLVGEQRVVALVALHASSQ